MRWRGKIKKLNLSSRQQVASNCPSAACTGDGKKSDVLARFVEEGLTTERPAWVRDRARRPETDDA
jgi:hypothetical protein